MDQRFGPYQVGETIGRGTFAKVKVAVHDATKNKVAMKVIPRKVMEEDPKSETKIKREIKILQVLRHPHVMRLYDVVQTKHDIILILEYVSGGELFDYISRRGKLTEAMARTFFQQLIAAVAYCHTFNVAHRDLKPENILLEQSMKSIKIGDFGLSSIMHDGKLFETSCGTPNYAAPEVVSGKLYNGREADIWSCGVVLFTMLAGGLPFDDPYVNLLFKKIQTATYQMPSCIPKGAQDLISRLLVPDPLERATIEQIMHHSWVREGFPVYLLSIHTSAIYMSGRFARDAITSNIDMEVVAYVALRYRMTPQRVAAVVCEAERSALSHSEHPEGLPDGRRLLSQSYSVADEKIKPEPVVIPSAEAKLRDEDHDVLVAYSILFDRKLSRKATGEGSPGSGQQSSQQRHADPNNPTSPPDHSSGAVPYRSLGIAASYTAQRFGGTSNAQQSGFEYGSLKEYSLGPQSHRAPVNSRAASTSAGGHLLRAPDGTMHMSPMFGSVTSAVLVPTGASAPTGPFVDLYLTGYNKTAKPRLTVSGTGKTLLGSLMGMTETHEDQVDPSALQQQQAPPSTTSSGNVKRLLARVDDNDEAPMPTRALPHAQPTLTHSIPLSTKPLSSRSAVQQCKFGGDFMRNGIAFRGTTAQAVYHVLCTALPVCGFVFRPLVPFSLVAVRPAGEKLLCKIFKIDKEDYLIDVRVSNQSGMAALEGATELLLVLLRCAEANQPINIVTPTTKTV